MENIEEIILKKNQRLIIPPGESLRPSGDGPLIVRYEDACEAEIPAADRVNLYDVSLF